MSDADKVKFGDLEDGDKFKYGGRLYEKDSVPEAIRDIIENAMCLEDFTGAMFEDSDKVTLV